MPAETGKGLTEQGYQGALTVYASLPVCVTAVWTCCEEAEDQSFCWGAGTEVRVDWVYLGNLF